MQFKSLLVDLKTKNSVSMPTADVALSPSNSLTFFRGQTFFSSAFTVKNKNGIFLLELDKHYERLLVSYDIMFSRHNFPFSFDEFKTYIQEAIQSNVDCVDENMHCIIYLVAGAPRALTFKDDVYSNGFGGYLEKLVILMNPYKKKPDWCYDKGLNLFTDIYQRPIASSKPANYLHGAITQHVVDALNVYACFEFEFNNAPSIDKALQKAYKFYESLSNIDQKAFLRFFNTILYEGNFLDSQALENLSQSLGIKIKAELSWLESIKLDDVNTIFIKHFPDLFHEVMFVGKGSNPYILEGSTFSFMGINKKNQCVFSPLTGNCDVPENSNSGSILNSTTISLLKRVAKKYDIQYCEMPFKLNDVLSFKAFYCISTTRIKLDNNIYHLQPCKTINTTPLNCIKTDTYTKLMTSLVDYCQQYSYDVEFMKKDYPFSVANS